MEIPRIWRWHQNEVWPWARATLRWQMEEAAKKLIEAEMVEKDSISEKDLPEKPAGVEETIFRAENLVE